MNLAASNVSRRPQEVVGIDPLFTRLFQDMAHGDFHHVMPCSMIYLPGLKPHWSTMSKATLVKSNKFVDAGLYFSHKTTDKTLYTVLTRLRRCRFSFTLL